MYFSSFWTVRHRYRFAGMQFMQFDAAVSKNYIFEIEIILYCTRNSVYVVNSTKRMSPLYI